MALTTRQYLRELGKDEEGKRALRKLFEIAKLDEDEYWLVVYAFIERRMRENTCAKLNIGKTKYQTMLNEVLAKLDYTIKDLDKVRTL